MTTADDYFQYCGYSRPSLIWVREAHGTTSMSAAPLALATIMDSLRGVQATEGMVGVPHNIYIHSALP